MSEPITAETITDEQIRELLHASAGRDALTRLQIATLCEQALGIRIGTLPGDHARARARCAEILNARDKR